MFLSQNMTQSGSKKRLFSEAFGSTQSTASQCAENFPTRFKSLLQEQQVALQQTRQDLLDPVKKNSVKSMVFLANQLVSKGTLSKVSLGKLIRSFRLPLELVWMLHCAELLHCTLYLESLDESNLASVSVRLAKLVQDGAVVSVDLIKSCAALAHGPEPPANLAPVVRTCHALLAQVERRLPFEEVDSAKKGPWWLVHLQQSLSPGVFARLAGSLLEVRLTSPPFISVHQALARQHEWKYPLPAFKMLLESQGSSTSALNLLTRVINEAREVNWKSALICVSSFVSLYSDADQKLSDLVRAWLSQALEHQEPETLLLCFVLIRQLGHASSTAPYASWFRNTFGSKHNTPCRTPAHFSYLLSFLNQLVQHEPLHCLKTHHEMPPYVPEKLRSELSDWRMMLFTRIKDLSNSNPGGIFPSEQGTRTQEQQVQSDVEKAIAHFESSKRVHELVMKAAICRKKYFDSHFIPALLIPRSGWRANDAQTRLIDSLLKVGKVSVGQFEAFHALCLERKYT
ncbi:Hypothetical predicted protein [Cloeon dipterum]|uniref:Fanconi anaemia group A protein N-terminal domain-containing protein n=2 Tax=Cloeon dipterum TaxID=197152 RepID=A0A8S1D980_9INSE|nr:Hypothetical predicted protein [Cloeon dipterum]